MHRPGQLVGKEKFTLSREIDAVHVDLHVYLLVDLIYLAFIAMRLRPTGRCGRKRGKYEEVDGGKILNNTILSL